jgi:hypothetical protein
VALSHGTEQNLHGYMQDATGSIPDWGMRHFLSPKLPDWPESPTKPPLQWVPGPFFTGGGEEAGREADHSPPFSDEVKSGRVVSPLAPCLQSMMLNRPKGQFYLTRSEFLATDLEVPGSIHGATIYSENW